MAFSLVYFFVVLIVSTAVSYALAPDMDDQSISPPDEEDYSFPTIEEGRPHPILFGRKKMDSPNVSWWGDVFTRSIKK